MKQISDKRRLRLENEKEDRIKMKLFFWYMWHEWDPKKSDVSGERILGEYSSKYFHHCLPKHEEYYKPFKFLVDGILRLTWDEHDKAEKDPVFFPQEVAIKEKILADYEFYSLKARKFEKEILTPLYDEYKHLF